MNGLLEHIASLQPDDADDTRFCMPGVVLGRECLVITNKSYLTGIEASQELSCLRGWADFRAWWNDSLGGAGDLEMPCEVLQSPARALVWSS